MILNIVIVLLFISICINILSNYKLRKRIVSLEMDNTRLLEFKRLLSEQHGTEMKKYKEYMGISNQYYERFINIPCLVKKVDGILGYLDLEVKVIPAIPAIKEKKVLKKKKE